MKRVLITGTAGFIDYHLAELLLAEGFEVHGYDGVTDYRQGIAQFVTWFREYYRK